LPFEPFLLKWVPDSIYLFARYGSEMVVYLLCGVVFVYFALGKIAPRRSPLDLPFVFFGLILVASSLINLVSPVVALLGVRQIVRFILLFFIVRALQPSREWIKGICVMLFIVAAAQTVIGVGQRASGGVFDEFLLPAERKTFESFQLTTGVNQFWDPGARVFGTLGRYDQLGTFLALVLLMVVAWLYERNENMHFRSLLWGLLCAGVICLGFTLSRSSWFGFLLGFLFIAVIMKRHRIVTLFAAILPALLLLYVMVSGLVVNRLLDSPDQGFVQRFFETFSADRWRGEYAGYARLYWIIRTVDTVVPSAPLFGWGPGQYGGGAVAALQNTTMYDALGLPFGVYGTGGYIDNNWMSLWGETGTLGLSAFLWLWGTGFFMCIAVYRESKDETTRAVALGTAAIFLAVSLNAFLATMLEVRTLAPYLWVLCGYVAVAGHREKILLYEDSSRT
jgi:O-antigen ligase